MKNIKFAIIALVIMGAASFGFTLIKEKSPVQISKKEVVNDISKTDQNSNNNQLASFD